MPASSVIPFPESKTSPTVPSPLMSLTVTVRARGVPPRVTVGFAVTPADVDTTKSLTLIPRRSVLTSSVNVTSKTMLVVVFVGLVVSRVMATVGAVFLLWVVDKIRSS